MQPEKKITVVQMLPELESGGVERGTLELGAYLAARGHKSLVISEGGRLVPQLEREGSRHITWPVGRKNPLTLRYIVPLRRLLRENQVDILHLRSRVPAWVGYLAWKSMARTNRPRLVTTFHGFYSVNKYSAIMAKGERIIAISRALARHIQEQYGVAAAKIELIYRGVDPRLFDPALVSVARIETLRQKWNLTKTPGPVIMLPGRITRLKGHELFLRALSVLQNQPWTAVCVGDLAENPRYAEELRNTVARHNLTERIKFVGHCDDMPAAYRLADLVVSATSTTPEAFGRIAIEAQTMGRPVVVPDQGGGPETVLPGRTGWLIRPNDAESLAKALREAIQAVDLREQYGAAGQKWVRDTFTVAAMCEKTVAIYMNLLKCPQ